MENSAQTDDLFFLLIYMSFLLLFSFAFVLTLKRILKKRNSRPLVRKEDENHVNDILSRIYSSVDAEDLRDLFAKEAKSRPRYHDLFKVAMEERLQQITQNNSLLSFEAKKSKIRKRWLFSFYAKYFTVWILAVASINLSTSELSERLIAVTIFSIFATLFMRAIYEAVYKKKGTFLLTLILISSPLSILSFVKEMIEFSFLYLTGEVIIDLTILSILCLSAIDFVLFVFFWFSSLRLRRINCEAKALQQLIDLRKNICFPENPLNTLVPAQP